MHTTKNTAYNAVESLLQYICQPTTSIQIAKMSFIQKTETLLKFLTINFVVQLFLSSITTLILFSVDFKLGSTTTNELTDFVQSNSYLYLLLVGGIALPFFEEIGFRLPLFFHPVSLGIAVSYVFILLLSILFPQAPSNPFFTLSMIGISLLIGGIGILFSFWKRTSIELFWKRYFRLIYYGFAVLFGFLHISNFSGASIWVFYLTPLLVLPQFLSGLVIGYIRMQFGFFWGFTFHAVWNSVLLSLAYAAYHFIIL